MNANETDMDARFTALSLLYGPPPAQWLSATWQYQIVAPIMFRIAAEKCFDWQYLARRGMQHFANEYARWYDRQEKANAEDHGRQSA